MHAFKLVDEARGRARWMAAFLPLAALLLWAGGCTCSGPGGGTTCTRTTCAAAGANCGEIDDGCGGTLYCGFCGGGMTCGGGGVDNVCGGACTRDNCATAGAECGTVGDGCGDTLRCGFCTGGAACGGGGLANLCGYGTSGGSGASIGGCVPRTCADAGATCGRIADGCGGVLECGASCAGGELCGGGGANLCGSNACTPTQTCAASACGFVSDGCAAVLDCGGCEGGLLCFGGSECRDVAGSVGTACTSDGACPAGVCLEEGSSGWPGGYCTTWCSADDECGLGNVCARTNGTGRGVCVKACASDTDCNRAGYLCLDPDGDGRRTCLPAGTGTGTVGDPCSTVADCAGGGAATCVPPSEGMSSGYCTVSCSATGVPCPRGSHCAFSGGSAVCMRDCASADQCRTGYACTDYDGDGTTECAPASLPGEPCASNSECTTGTCLTEASTGWPGGYCTSDCTTSADCGGDLACVADGTGAKHCMPTCTSSRDCRTGYACVTADGGAHVCLPYGGGTGTVGAPCSSVEECQGGADAICISEQTGYPGGYCTVSCQLASDCGSGQVCEPLLGSGTQVCQKTCASQADCRSGYTCDTSTDPGVCRPAGSITGDGASGSACTSYAQCKLATCLSQENTGWRDGYCSGVCQTDADCDTGAHCGSFQTTQGGDSFGVCLADCGSGCRAGYTCWDWDHDGRNECAGWAGGPGVPGDACTTLDDCGGGEPGRCATESEGWPGGYCVQDCTSTGCPTGSRCSTVGYQHLCLDSVCCARYIPCSVDVDNHDNCPTGLQCLIQTTDPNGGGTGICSDPTKTCSPTHSCPAGYICSNDGGGVCLVCDSDDRCRDSYECYDGTGDGQRECWPAGKGNGQPGAPCTSVATCAGGVRATCLQSSVAWLPDGYCTVDCRLGDPCPSGSTCSNVAVDDGHGNVEHFYFCLDLCGSASDCRQGYDCAVVDPTKPPVCFTK